MSGDADRGRKSIGKTPDQATRMEEGPQRRAPLTSVINDPNREAARSPDESQGRYASSVPGDSPSPRGEGRSGGMLSEG